MVVPVFNEEASVAPFVRALQPVLERCGLNYEIIFALDPSSDQTEAKLRALRQQKERLAKKIEEVVMWQPGKEEGGPLQGTPDDPRFKYIKYD